MKRRYALLAVGIAAIGGNADAAVRIFRPDSASQVVLELDTPMARARILQHRHDFRAAEQELEPVLRLNPRDTRARLLRAQIRIHLRDSQGAMQDCVALAPLADILTSSICMAQARALRGDLEQSYALVTTALQAQQGTPDIRSWGAGVAAEIAAQLGDAQKAEYWYRTALELDPDTHFPRVAYAGWLRSQGKTAEAQTIEGTSR